MKSINAELDIIQLIEEELNDRKENKFRNQLKHLKKLANTIECAINTGENDYYVHKATTILCKDLGILWREVFHIED